MIRHFDNYIYIIDILDHSYLQKIKIRSYHPESQTLTIEGDENLNKYYVSSILRRISGCFYSRYLRHFEKGFLRIKLSNLDISYHNRDWINYFINEADSIHKTWYDISSVTLHNFLSGRFNIDYKPKFEKYLPLITLSDYLEFGVDNFESENFDIFYILIGCYIEECIPSITDSEYGEQDYIEERVNETNYHEGKSELYDCQKEIIETFISLMPETRKELIIKKLLSVFEQLNELEIFRLKLSKSYNKIMCIGPQINGNLYIPWENIIFKNGYLHIYHPLFPNGEENHPALIVKEPNSREVMNKLKVHFDKSLPQIRAYAEGAIVKRIIEYFNIEKCIKIMENTIKVDNKPPIKVKRKINHIQSNKPKELLDKCEAKNIVKKFKSRYLDYLCACHSDEYKVICCIEKKINTSNSIEIEYSFIFTIKADRGYILLAYENVKDARCTYLIKVNERRWEETVNILFEFFSSNMKNKRENLARKFVELYIPYYAILKRVFHTDYYKWTQKIKHSKTL